MKVIITKKQYKNLAFSLLDNIVGDLKLDSEYEQGEAYIKVLDSYGENTMDVWLRKSAIPKGCKKELNVSIETSELIFSYLPLVRKKIFSEVFLEYFYMKTKYKCDCVDFYYPIDKKDENDDFVYRKFTYKKKKKFIKESVKDSNIVEKILEMAEIKYEGCGFGGRTYDNFGRKVDTVEMYFKFPNESKLRSRSIHFITRNNKVVTVESSSDFRTLYDGLRYIPELNLMEYFIEKAKTYLERILRYEYPSDNLKIQESVDKNKKFLINYLGEDFISNIEQITSTYDVPMSFDDGIAPSTINMYLNLWGPMYLFELDGVKYLYQDRGNFEMFIDEEGYGYVDGEIPEKLGIGVMGLKFSHIIDIFFNED